MHTVAHEEQVVSADGTRIAVRVSGTGPAVVVAPGSLGRASDWGFVAAELAGDATLYAIDRRGRGGSGPVGDHSLAKEGEDLAAVRALAGPDAVVLGHSYGAIVALAQALLDPPRALIVYEPPLPLDGPVAGDALADYEAATREGRLEDAMTIGATNFLRAPADVIEQMRATPVWPALVSMTPTWVPELRAIDAYGPDLTRFESLDIPVLLLVGEMSPPWLADTSERLAAVLPQSRIVRLPGQGHDAHVMAPALVAGAVRDVLNTL
jgi:pimeloyl-ACP methyl ester carboxylesterase